VTATRFTTRHVTVCAMQVPQLREIVRTLGKEPKVVHSDAVGALFSTPSWILTSIEAREIMLVGEDDELLVRIDGSNRTVTPIESAWVVYVTPGVLRVMSSSAFESTYEPAPEIADTGLNAPMPIGFPLKVEASISPTWEDLATSHLPIMTVPNDPKTWKEITTTVASTVAKSDIVDQPPPIDRPDLVPSWEAVISDMTLKFGEDPDPEVVYRMQEAVADMRDRDRLGRERYGVPLTAHNGRDQIIDCYQELLDGTVYMRSAILEGVVVPQERYQHMLDAILWARTFITDRDRAKESQ
jgi:hypothetical protein